MIQHECLIAYFGFDTTENETSYLCPVKLQPKAMRKASGTQAETGCILSIGVILKKVALSQLGLEISSLQKLSEADMR